MSLALLLVALAVVGVVAAVAAGAVGGGLSAPTGTSPHRPLPSGRIAPGDLDDLRFSRALRGYRMDEVDAVLARLRAELAERTPADLATAGPATAGHAATAAEPRPAQGEG